MRESEKKANDDEEVKKGGLKKRRRNAEPSIGKNAAAIQID